MKALKLPFAILNGIVVEISSVDSGLKCGCKCPKCSEPVIARKGSVRIHHFAHRGKSDCPGSYETAIHIAAKQLIQTEGKLRIPEYRDHLDEFGVVSLIGEQIIEADSVELEKSLGGFRPDVIIKRKEKPLIVEIAVSNPVTTDKRFKIEKIGVSAIEVDLSDVRNESISLSELKDMVIYKVDRKRWIHNEKANDLYRDEYLRLCQLRDDKQRDEDIKVQNRRVFKMRYRKPIIVRRSKKQRVFGGKVYHVDDCSEQKNSYQNLDGSVTYYANVHKDCLKCKKYFRGYQNGKKYIVCLASYYQSKRQQK